jgi:signal transduction histidine kinase
MMNPMRSVLHTFWRDLSYHLVGLPATILAFTVVVAGFSIGVSFAVLIVGLPIALGVFAVFRWNARLERYRTAWALGRPVAEAYRPRSGGLLKRLRTVLGDPQSWKDVAWLAFAGTFGFAASVFAVTAWATVLGTVVLPAWYWALPRNGPDFGLFRADTLGEAFLAGGLAVLTIPILYLIERWKTEGLVRLGAALLSPTREAALSARVTELAATRAGAVDAAAAELQRIERDLHDGAQARLVALAMDLGMAEERFARDPDGARELVGEAREEAKRALAELRDLARGIRPSLLAERGLGPALTALAARSPVPTSVDLDVPEGLPAAVENATWFVVSEALANAGKHSSAGQVLISVGGRDGRLVVEVSDNGRGGADPGGDGLTGLRRRVEALDGTLSIESPRGGPTLLRVELPCAS